MANLNSISRAVVITSIAAPNAVLCAIAKDCQHQKIPFYLIGDTKSPATFTLDGCQFYSLAQQRASAFTLAQICPEKHYARKNIGYLFAIQAGAQVIQETDDDNFPNPEFWTIRAAEQTVPTVRDRGWLNVYRYFSDQVIWPRGLPLDEIHSPLPIFDNLPLEPVYCPIQQGLADQNPDVDAIYRLVLPLPQQFRRDRVLALSQGTWCPFNSQNTTWWRPAFPLLYLPTYCSFRMTDIWRSFIAQRIAWENNWSVLFHAPTVWQERNEHNLMQDFQQEVAGYLHNREFCEILANLDLKSGVDAIADNLRRCYEKLIHHKYFVQEEMQLLEAWLTDLSAIGFW
jgi:hypothetical protein